MYLFLLSINFPVSLVFRGEHQDPFLSPQYLQCFVTLKERLSADTFRDCCKTLGAINRRQVDKLKQLSRTGGTEAEHNDELLGILETRGDKGFAQLCEIVRFVNEAEAAYDGILTYLGAVECRENEEGEYS